MADDIRVPPGLTMGEGDWYRQGWRDALAWLREQEKRQADYATRRTAAAGPKWKPLVDPGGEHGLGDRGA